MPSERPAGPGVDGPPLVHTYCFDPYRLQFTTPGPLKQSVMLGSFAGLSAAGFVVVNPAPATTYCGSPGLVGRLSDAAGALGLSPHAANASVAAMGRRGRRL